MAHRNRLRNPGIGLETAAVKAAPQRTMDARAERRAMIALFAVFALLFQAMVPSLASAAAGPGAAPICRPLADANAPAGSTDPAAPAPGQPCQHCVCPAIAAAPPPSLSILRIAYEVERAPMAPQPRALRPPARAPPRPPGQGPPLPNA
jgi:hypothetical protein